MKIPDMTSQAIWTWLKIIEAEADRLSEGGQSALDLLREDLESLSESDKSYDRIVKIMSDD